MIKEIHIKELTFAEYNPRQVHKGAIERLAKSLSSPQGKELFKRRPILANKRDGKLIVYAGNMRLRAAISLGMKEVPVIIDEISLDEEKERNVKDNLVIGEWDDDLLANNFDLEQLEDWGMDLKELGIEPEGEEETDEVPEPPKEALAKLGQLFILGKHRLLCGDSTKAEDVSLLMDGKKADLIFTDPPYGANISGMMQDVHGSGSIINRTRRWEQIKGDENEDKDLQAFLEKAFKNASNHAKDNAAWYIWHAMLTQGFFAAAAAAADLILNRQIIWVKPCLILAFGDYHWRHELCFYGWKKGNRPEFYGEKNETTVWEIDFDGKGRMPSSERNHPTQKPVNLCVRALKNSSLEDQIVLDLFLGSGSFLIACEQQKRICYGMELAESYCDVIIKRYCNFTGANEEEIYNSAVQVVQERVAV